LVKGRSRAQAEGGRWRGQLLNEVTVGSPFGGPPHLVGRQGYPDAVILTHGEIRVLADNLDPCIRRVLRGVSGPDRAYVLDQLGEELQARAGDEVRELVAAGSTWSEVASAFGVAKQSAHERFTRRRW
jgi:hypothetical protein